MMLPARPSVLARLATPRRYLDRGYLERVAGSLYGGSARDNPGQITAAMNNGNRVGPSRGYLYQLAAGAGWTSVPFLPLVRQPTLIAAGDDDPIIPLANARLMNLLIPKSRLHVYPGGHLGLVTEAADLAPVVDAFLAAPLAVSRRAQAGASPQPSRWPSLVTAPHSGQTRLAQHTASPPSAGSSSCRRRRARTAA